MTLNIPESEWKYKEWIEYIIKNKKDVLGSKNDNMLKIYYFHSNQRAKQELEKNAKKQGEFHIVSMNYNESATKNTKKTEYWMHELEPGLLIFFTSSTKEGYEKTLQQKIRKIFGLHEMWIKPDTFKRIRKDLIKNKKCGITKFLGYRRKYDNNPQEVKEEAERRIHYFTDNPIDGILRLDELEYRLGIMPKTIEYVLHSDKIEITNEGLFVLKTVTQESFNLVDYVIEKIRMEEKDMREIAQGLKFEQKIVVFPFIQQNNIGSKLGYTFFACDPFYEREWRNFDCLVYKEEDKITTLVFIEIKTSFSDDGGSIINEIKEKKKFIKSNIEIIENQLNINSKTIIIEYVIVVKSYYSDIIKNALEVELNRQLKNEAYQDKTIIWKIEHSDNTFGLVNPGNLSDHRFKMVHCDHELNKILSKGIKMNTQSFTFFPQSHIVTQMNSLIIIRNRNMLSIDKRNIITKNSLENFCNYQLINHDENSKKKIINDIIKTAVEIGLLFPDTTNKCENEECYFINKQYLGRSLNESLIKKLWIENKFISVNEEFY